MKILMTGANGFLGKKLARDLLKEGHILYLLVRNSKKLNSFIESIESPQMKSRVNIIEGDVTLNNLGVSEELQDNLRGELDAIFHMAALLSFDPKDKEKSYQVNVQGTKNTLEFAKNLSCIKFFYVSTAYTIGLENEGSEKLYSTNRSFVNNYEETKCLAEHLVSSYQDQMFVNILRPSIIIGDSVTGEADTSFGLYGLLKSLLVLKRKISRKDNFRETKFHIMLNTETTANLVPVDYVSTVLVAALQSSENGDIFNVTNPYPLKQGDILKIIKDTLELPSLYAIGFDSEHQLREDEKLFNKPLSAFKSYWGRDIYFPCENTKELLSKSGKPILNMDDKMLSKIISSYIMNR
ncbi:SDR family oxidoreductase [Cytobacillus sp. FJAT-54145]|uniref:SDR family oxidoreductase n=1 Tax=Cytobacillus spartinae TaxID=3299023 RepID=A0ABW6K630_9BACI